MDRKILSADQENWLISKLGEDRGREKLHLLETYQKKWHLHGIAPAQTISHNNLIFYAVSEKYGKVMLKILLNDGFDQDIPALRAFQGSKFVSLYEYSLADGICLIEQIIPGKTLFEETSRNERIKIFSGIFKGLHPTVSKEHQFPFYYDWFKFGKDGAKGRKDCEPFRPYLEKAEKIILSISGEYPQTFLLHGDLHHENILKTAAGTYKVIDPKGVVGNPVFDLSRFIMDEFSDDLTSEPKAYIVEFVQTLGAVMGVPEAVLFRCLFAETVIWLFREELSQGANLQDCAGLAANMKIANELLRITHL